MLESILLICKCLYFAHDLFIFNRLLLCLLWELKVLAEEKYFFALKLVKFLVLSVMSGTLDEHVVLSGVVSGCNFVCESIDVTTLRSILRSSLYNNDVKE